MTLHFSHIGLTEARTFMELALLSKEGPADPRSRIGRVGQTARGGAHYRNAGAPDRLMLAGAERSQPAANPVAALAASGQFSCHGVMIRGPSGVTATVCS